MINLRLFIYTFGDILDVLQCKIDIFKLKKYSIEQNIKNAFLSSQNSNFKIQMSNQIQNPKEVFIFVICHLSFEIDLIFGI